MFSRQRYEPRRRFLASFSTAAVQMRCMLDGSLQRKWLF
jgi:hypothetical protein